MYVSAAGREQEEVGSRRRLVKQQAKRAYLREIRQKAGQEIIVQLRNYTTVRISNSKKLHVNLITVKKSEV